jgi:hypothetical protein
MDTVKDLTSIVKEAVEGYAADGWQLTDYQISDTARQTFAVVSIADYPPRWKPSVVVMARVVDDHVIIDVDITDRPLVDELERAGIRREKIVLAYLGQTLSGQAT